MCDYVLCIIMLFTVGIRKISVSSYQTREIRKRNGLCCTGLWTILIRTFASNPNIINNWFILLYSFYVYSISKVSTTWNWIRLYQRSYLNWNIPLRKKRRKTKSNGITSDIYIHGIKFENDLWPKMTFKGLYGIIIHYIKYIITWLSFCFYVPTFSRKRTKHIT